MSVEVTGGASVTSKLLFDLLGEMVTVALETADGGVVSAEAIVIEVMAVDSKERSDFTDPRLGEWELTLRGLSAPARAQAEAEAKL